MSWKSYDSGGAEIQRSVTDLPVGTVVGNARSTTPYGWLSCDGSAVSRTTYSDLFAAIGTAYGTGNGTTTFNLPNSDGDMILAVSTAEKFGINDGSGVVNASITTAKLADNAVTADKLAAALANNLGVDQTGVTNRAAMTPMTTERTTSSSTLSDVTGASMTFTVVSGSYLFVGWNCQLKHDTSSNAYVRVMADAAICNPTWAGPGVISGGVANSTYQKVGGMAMFSAAEVGTGSKTFKFQFALGSSGTARIDECYMTVTQVTF